MENYSVFTSVCPFCHLVGQLDHSARLTEFEHSVAFLHQDQSYLGRSLLILKRHCDHLHEVPEQLLAPFNREMRQLADALFSLLQPDRLNYAMLGNHVSHVHWHIIPRYQGDPNWGNWPWPAPGRNKLTKTAYLSLAEEIRTALT